MSESVMTIDQPVIDRLLENDIAKLLPCLQRVPREYTPPCGGCTTSSALDYNKIKDCLMSSGSSDIELLKRHFNVSRLRFKKATMHNGQPTIETVTR